MNCANESDSLKPNRRLMKAAGAEIDWLVYDLYGLTKEEIAIVEKNQGKGVQVNNPEPTEKKNS